MTKRPQRDNLRINALPRRRCGHNARGYGDEVAIVDGVDPGRPRARSVRQQRRTRCQNQLRRQRSVHVGHMRHALGTLIRQSNAPVLNLGGWCTVDGMASGSALHLHARHLVTQWR